MILNRIDDPRSNLDKARRSELVRFAQENNISGITENMPAILIRRKLQEVGKTHIKISPRPLGSQGGAGQAVSNDVQVTQIDAADDLARQFSSQASVPVERQSINELRAECKKRGIKLSNRDTLKSMREKLGL